MARAEQKRRADNVRIRRTSRGTPNRSGPALTLLAASVLAAAWAGGMLTGAGRTAYTYLFFFTEFYAGVVTLVALSLTVLLGLLATDRLVLLVPHRVLMQSAHRTTGIIGVSGLVLHVLTKIATGRAAATDAAVPFLGGRGLYVGLGTVAALLMVSVLWTGLVRARFAGVGPKWLWRSLHATAYLSWPFSLLHGLGAGRPPATWVTVSYLACVLLVVVALLVRLSVSLGRRRRERAQHTAPTRAVAGRADERASLRVRLTRRRGADPATAPARGRSVRRTADWTEHPAPASGRRAGRVTASGRPADRDPVSGRRAERVTTERGRSERVTADRGRSERVAGDDRSTDRADRRSRRFAVPVVPPPGTVAGMGAVGRRRRRAEEATDGPLRTPTFEPVPEPAREAVGRRRRVASPPAAARHAVPEHGRPDRVSEAEAPWDSPTRWAGRDSTGTGSVSIGGNASAGTSGFAGDGVPAAGSLSAAGSFSVGGRHSADEDAPDLVTDYWRPPARYVPDDTPLPPDDTPTLVDLAARRARRAAGESRSARRRRAHADAVDGAYWAGLRGEAK
ncbi:hypothetical protein [Micromonospora cathayae]|uniref:DMSO/TMAO reductase YedYZ, heme-binding membrane subunit n=1 Tax=Micromonospora cathayae TaxID=3028804 RepID=A0ABY7ZP11_9ACTN|nr:hypothetical protein [Micromonospora sp. HUAS 3]WDZ84645.1 hypothetical protein PVK37_30160 [Micromonospora sp. HUAS 3]